MSDPLLFDLHALGNGKHLGVITLNSPGSLNALSLPMIRMMAPKLAAWALDESIVCVLLWGAGEKAFCAGGDVVSLCHAIREGDYSLGDTFFAEEYALDYAIHTYPKPFIAWGHGIVMGGGVGLMDGASHRIVTERSRIAMPEISIGLYPDVGGSWMLSRLPARLGLYLGLTGASLNAADALFLGMAEHALPARLRGDLLNELASIAWCGDAELDRQALSARLRELSRSNPLELAPSQVREHFDAIQSLCDYDSLDDIVEAIIAGGEADDWLGLGARKLAAGSPTSMRLIEACQRRARHLSLKEVFAMELTVSRQCLRHPDFAEGVRALLVDKDLAPHWFPARLQDVSRALLEEFFQAPE